MAGTVQLFVGWFYSMSLLSDALHSLSDGVADIVAAFFTLRKDKEEMRNTAKKIIALLLVGGAIWIAIETYQKLVGADYQVSLWAVLFFGMLGFSVDLIRMLVLTNARTHNDTTTVRGLYEHVNADMWHSAIVSITALLGLVGTLLLWLGLLLFHREIDKELYNLVIRWIDCTLSWGLTAYMIFIAAPRIWFDKDDHH
ncbi:MAG: cation transporter [Candidatus Pacebacteria bacterium]|nr:cation transporter [Candidatus Paceibacterota bacterium]